MKVLSFASILAIALSGCSASEPGGLPDLQPDAGEPDDPEMPTLVVEPVGISTPWPSIPMHGRGPSNGTVVIDLPGGGQDTLSLGAAGDFCVDIELAEGDNTVRFEAISKTGVYTAPEVLSVRREGEPPEPPEPIDEPVLADRTPGSVFSKAVDRGCCAYGAAVEAETGRFDELVDGDTNKFMKLKGSGALPGEFIIFSLKERMAVYGFEVTVPDQDGDTCGPEAFEMWISDMTNPEPLDDGVNFVRVAELPVQEASATAATYELDSTVAGIHSQHMALKITDATCHPWGLSSVTGVSEIRVIAERDGVSEPNYDGKPSCASGGF